MLLSKAGGLGHSLPNRPFFAKRMRHTMFGENFAPSRSPTLSLSFPFDSTYFAAESDWDLTQAEDLLPQPRAGGPHCVLLGPWQLCSPRESG